MPHEGPAAAGAGHQDQVRFWVRQEKQIMSVRFALQTRAAVVWFISRGFERRPIVVINNRHLRAILHHWHLQSLDKSRRKRRMKKAAALFQKRECMLAWNRY